MQLRPPKKFQTSKAGNRPEECEDASWVVYPYSLAVDGSEARLSVADGASESAFAREWAEILAKAFVSQTAPLDLAALTENSLKSWLKPRQDAWNRAVPWERIPWHGEAKARAGAMAAFLGVTIQAAPNGGGIKWQAVAVGDCCLFVVRDDTLEMAWPLDASGQFNNTPSLICSNSANDAGLWERVRQRRGECRPGDRIILASDALACWILQESESGGRPWDVLMSLSSEEQWEAWLQARRRESAMRNDDTTLIMVNAE